MLLSRLTHPPGGFKFYESKTGWHAPETSFDGVVDAVIAHRRANSRLSWSTLDPRKVAHEVDLFNCERLNWDPKWCDTQKKTPSTTIPSPSSGPSDKPRQDLPSESSPHVPLARQAGEIVVGAKVLAEWLGEGGKPVEQALAESRGQTCINCPLNQPPGTMSRKISKKVAEKILEHVEAKNGLGLRVAGEDRLGTCDACGCHLPLKIFVPIEFIADGTSKKTLKQLHADCWIRSEIAGSPSLVKAPAS